MPGRYAFAQAILAALLLYGASSAWAQTIDSHQVYEGRCAGCHVPHAGDFANRSLKRAVDKRTGDKIVAIRSGKDLRQLLAGGHGKLSAREVDAVVAHFVAILTSGMPFREKCSICHGRAVVLARGQLIVENGRLVGRYTDRDIEAFLRGHGRLGRNDLRTIMRMLRRQLDTKPD